MPPCPPAGPTSVKPYRTSIYNYISTFKAEGSLSPYLWILLEKSSPSQPRTGRSTLRKYILYIFYCFASIQ